MNPHVLDWLPAYHDGELSPSRRLHVDEHLRDCAACRDELRAFESLSSLLGREAVPGHTPAPRFAAQVRLRLPRTPARESARRETGGLPRWLIGAPLVLVVGGAFMQAALWLTAVLLAAIPLLGAGAAPFTGWLSAGSVLENEDMLAILYIGLLAGAAVLWGAWMALWWTWTRTHNQMPEFAHLEKEV